MWLVWARRLPFMWQSSSTYSGNDPDPCTPLIPYISNAPSFLAERAAAGLSGATAWEGSYEIAVSRSCIFSDQSVAVQPSQALNAFSPDQVKWGPAPPFVPPGAKIAVLEGDPTATSGDFTIRLSMPDGYKVAPHTHPHRENVTVLSGTLKVGMGETFDTGKNDGFGAGSSAYLIPACTTMPRLPGTLLSRSTECRRCSSTISIRRMTPRLRSNGELHTTLSSEARVLCGPKDPCKLPAAPRRQQIT